ncbi:helix-turn-helix domain-containing protein [Massilia scottii]|uniref:helix-turn-helix domain-containing protein n=1 Tax=Massilia scottii TaxID=3057166 RepID=UPI002796694B|nr:helix-turn-helix domain-containing protein [Massilia sp. CCM 9029]MDQ1833892.1 helix-turn-helix domain-containing protein [Massilia sp. CCM 9029]
MLTESPSWLIFTPMIDPRQMPSPDDPAEALAAVVALRRYADALERKAVNAAVKQGWSWSDIAQALGVSKQAAHKRLAGSVTDEDS